MAALLNIHATSDVRLLLFYYNVLYIVVSTQKYFTAEYIYCTVDEKKMESQNNTEKKKTTFGMVDYSELSGTSTQKPNNRNDTMFTRIANAR